MYHRIRSGTARSDTDLCPRCIYLHRTLDRLGNEIRLCTFTVRPIDSGHTTLLREPVIECTSFSEKGRATMYELTQTAWILRTDKMGRQIGFTPYCKLTREEKQEVDDDL